MGVFSLTGWSRQIHTRFLVSRATWEQYPASSQVFSYRIFTFYDRTFQTVHLTFEFLTRRTDYSQFWNCPTTPPAQRLQAWHVDGLGSSLFARRYLGNHFYFLFLELLRCVSSLRWLYPPYIFKQKYLEINPGGLPHSDIPGSKVICTYPRLIAAYHVLHRLHVPRHPPYTLSSFTKVLFLKMTWLHWITGQVIQSFQFPNCQKTLNL